MEEGRFKLNFERGIRFGQVRWTHISESQDINTEVMEHKKNANNYLIYIVCLTQFSEERYEAVWQVLLAA